MRGHGYYVGPRRDLFGRAAILAPHPQHRDWCKAQFGDVLLPRDRRRGVDVTLANLQDANSLGYGLTTFPRRDFRRGFRGTK